MKLTFLCDLVLVPFSLWALISPVVNGGVRQRASHVMGHEDGYSRVPAISRVGEKTDM